MLTLDAAQPVLARHGPTRHDRRPDRETRIRYPRSSGYGSHRQGSPQQLHSAPPASSDAGTATPDEPAPSLRPADSANQHD